MAFHNSQFPEDISWSSSGGPGYRTDVIEMGSGAEERVSRWTNAKHRYNVSYGVKSYEQLSTLKKFYMARKGAANTFPYKDFLDYATTSSGKTSDEEVVSEVDVLFATGDGVETAFQLVKYYTDGVIIRTRAITKPVLVAIAVNGTLVAPEDYSVNDTSGIVTFNTAPANDASITWGGTFNVHVRFAAGTDNLLAMSLDDFGSGSASGIELVEVLEEVTATEEYFYGGAMVLDPMTANYTLSYASPRVIACAPSGAGRRLVLPDPDDGAEGGPHFIVLNTSLVNTFEVHYPSGTVLATIPVGTYWGGVGRQFCIGVNGSNVKQWIYQ